MSPDKLPHESFSTVDAAWLHMDKPTNLAMITGVMSFPEPLDFARLQATIEARFLPFIRFRQRVREANLPLGLPRWELDANFDIAYHLQHVALPEPGDHAALQNLVSELMSIPLDRSRPLWQMHYIDNYMGGSALVSRLHHCIADGIALTQVLLSMTDETSDAPWPEPYEEPQRELSQLARFFLPAVKSVKAVNRTWQSAENMVHEGMEMLIHPAHLRDAARYGTASGLAFGKLLLIPPDRKTILKRKCGISKRAAWSKSIRVEEVKAVGRMMGGTINDVLLSAVTGAIRRYLEERGEPVQGLNIRALVPVNLRPDEEIGELGNRFGLVFLSLPIGVSDPIRRLVLLKRRMDAIKNSPEAVVAFGILNVIGMTPVQIEKIIIAIFGMKGTAVMTNVPGPRQTIYLAGKPISSLIVWVPSPANLSIGVSILSYAGDIILGIATDESMVADPERMIELFQLEFTYLKSWGRPAE
jgi:diacylglycerol O-acyltransferase / wax synthase